MHAEQAEFAQLRGDLAGREGARLEPLRDVRTQPLGREGRDGVPDLALVLGQQRIGGEEFFHGDHGLSVNGDGCEETELTSAASDARFPAQT
jgi:hypothetical protein